MESKKVTFSIIIAAYNVETYIEEAIESVLNQEYENYEIIIVDDCSKDETRNKIRKYTNEKIQIYTTKENTGTAGGARNVGLDHAKGEYILFLDGDDILYDTKVLTKIKQVMDQDHYDMAFFGYQDLGNSNKLRLYNEENSTKKARIICDISFSVSAKCWSNRFIQENHMRFKEGMYYEDEVFCTLGNILANKTVCGGFPIFYYRRNRDGSVMSTPSIKKCSDWYRMLAELVDMVALTPKEYEPYLLSFIKNEGEMIPLKIKAILKSLKRNTGTPVLPKRKFNFDNFMEE